MFDDRFSNHVLMHKLRELLDENKNLDFVEDCIGQERERAVHNMRAGDILLLENVRFYVEEETNDPLFCQELAKGVDIYVSAYVELIELWATSLHHGYHLSYPRIYNITSI
tara:strand:+ start:251 stop:583 length:333 start_codon:yes stop_codon:yes gene_type:complete